MEKSLKELEDELFSKEEAQEFLNTIQKNIEEYNSKVIYLKGFYTSLNINKTFLTFRADYLKEFNSRYSALATLKGEEFGQHDLAIPKNTVQRYLLRILSPTGVGIRIFSITYDELEKYQVICREIIEETVKSELRIEHIVTQEFVGKSIPEFRIIGIPGEIISDSILKEITAYSVQLFKRFGVIFRGDCKEILTTSSKERFNVEDVIYEDDFSITIEISRES